MGPRPAGPGAVTRTTGPGGARGLLRLGGGGTGGGGGCRALPVEGAGGTNEAEVEGRAVEQGSSRGTDWSELVEMVSLTVFLKLSRL